MAQCPSCQFVSDPYDFSPVEGQCPNCGGDFYARQPSPLKSEMAVRDIPAPGEKDMGGNPLQEGILADGGWQNRNKRDESFASVTGAWYDEEPHGDCPECGYSGTHWYRRKDFKDGDPNDESRVCSNCGADEIDPLQAHFDTPAVEHPLGPHTGSELNIPDTFSQEAELPWYLAEVSDVPMSVIDTEVAPPGPHTVEVPVQSPGLHGEVLHGLQQLGVHVNGEPITDDSARELEKNWSPHGPTAEDPEHLSDWHRNEGQNVMLSHDDPKALDLAQEIVKQGGIMDTVKGLGQGILDKSPILHGTGPMQNMVKNIPGVGGLLNQGIQDQGYQTGINLVRDVAQGNPGKALQGEGQLGMDAALAGAGAGGAGALAKGARAAGGLSKLPLIGGLFKGGEEAAGGGGGLAGKAWPFAKRYLQYQGVNSILNQAMGGMGGGAGAAGQQQQGADRPYQMLTHVAGEDFEHPSTHPEIPQGQDDSGDTQQKEDGEGYYGNPDVNDIGGTTTGDPHEKGIQSFFHPFDPNGPVGERFDDLIPKMLQFFFSDQSGDDDPELKELFGLMDQEQPGWDQDDDSGGHDPMNETPDDEAKHGAYFPTCPNCGSSLDPSNLQCPQCQAAGHPEAFMNLMQQGQDGNQVQSNFNYDPTEHVNYVGTPDIAPGMSLHGNPQPCARCGEQVDPRTGTCPCGYQKTSGDSQGPHTPEQFKVVSEYLIAQGRTDEIPHMFEAPWEYADVLAQLIGRDAPPDAIDAQPQPAQEEAPPEATMPVPGMNVPGGDRSSMPAPPSMMSAVKRYSETGTMDHTHQDLHPNFLGVPKADQQRQEDVEQEQDSSLTWQDENGNPLKIGHEYEMYTAKFDIPDIVQITAVKPNSIEYVLTGAYGLDHSTEISREEANLDQYSFRPVEGNDSSEIQNEGLETNMDDFERAQPGQNSDLSTPHMMQSRRVFVDQTTGKTVTETSEKGVDHDDPNLDWLKTSGKHFTPMEQRDLIDERGEARNRDKLDLAGTHYEDPDDEDFLLW